MPGVVSPAGEHRGWAFAAYAVAALLVIGVAAVTLGIPLPLNDFASYLLDMQPHSMWEVLADRFQSAANFRPFFYAYYKTVLVLSGGAYFAAFKTAHVALLTATILLSIRLLRVRTAAGFAASAVVAVVLLGTHTAIDALREGPMLMPFCVAASLNVASADRGAWWRDLLAVLLLVVATLTVELGLLIWVAYVVGRVAGWRGVSRGAIVVSTLLVAAYFGYRFTVLNPGGADLEMRWTGYGFEAYEPEQLAEMFRGRMYVLYAYNVLAGLLSVLFSEPRHGVWYFVAGLVEGNVRPWLWLGVVSSAAATTCLVWYSARRVRRWLRGDIPHDDVYVVVGIAVLVASAAIGHRYVRDVIMYPAGVLYALALYPALRAALERLPALPPLRRSVMTVLLVTIAATWTLRTMGAFYVLRTAAYEKRNEWGDAFDVLERRNAVPTGERLELLLQLRRDALSRRVPHPLLAQPALDEWTDPLY